MGEGERAAANISRLAGGKRKADDDAQTPVEPPKRPRFAPKDARARGPGIDRLLSLTATDLENGNFRKAATNLRSVEKSRFSGLLRDSLLGELLLSLDANIGNAEMRHHEMVEASMKIWPKAPAEDAGSDQKHVPSVEDRTRFWKTFLSAAAGVKFLDEAAQMEIVDCLVKSGKMDTRAAYACNACEYIDDFKEKPRAKLLAMALNLFPHAEREVQLRIYEQVSRAKHEGYLNTAHLDFIDRTGKAPGAKKFICRETLENAAGSIEEDMEQYQEESSAAVMETKPLFSKAAYEIDPMGNLDKARSNLRDLMRYQGRERDVGR